MRAGRKTVRPNVGFSVFMNSHTASSDSFLELEYDTNMWFACRAESWVMPSQEELVRVRVARSSPIVMALMEPVKEMCLSFLAYCLADLSRDKLL